MKIEDGYRPNDFFEYGYDHIEAGFELLKLENPRFYDSAAYLICIGYECLLKAWLLHSNQSVLKIHNIEELFEEIKNLELLSTESVQVEIVKRLNQYGIKGGVRYPNHNSPVSVGDEDFESFRELINFTFNLMPEDLRSTQQGEHFIKGGRILVRKPR
jgi:HEPN domain-containing protein